MNTPYIKINILLSANVVSCFSISIFFYIDKIYSENIVLYLQRFLSILFWSEVYKFSTYRYRGGYNAYLNDILHLFHEKSLNTIWKIASILIRWNFGMEILIFRFIWINSFQRYLNYRRMPVKNSMKFLFLQTKN